MKENTSKLRLGLTLFLSYFKIGLFTFGGGYAMIALIEREFVMRKKWINEVELYEIIAIAESTPGPIAINCATFVGYKILGFVGSFLATLAVCIPSFVIIYLISIFYDKFMALTAVAYAFEGIKVGIALMITTAGISMMKKAKKNAFAIGIFMLTFAAAVCIDIFNLNFSTIYLILIGGAAGIILQIVKDVIAKKKGVKNEATKEEQTDIGTGTAAKEICRQGADSYPVSQDMKTANKEHSDENNEHAESDSKADNKGEEDGQ